MKIKIIILLIFFAYNSLSSQIYFNISGNFSKPIRPDTFSDEWEGKASFGAGIGWKLKEGYYVQIDFNQIKFGLGDKLINELKYEQLMSTINLMMIGVKVKTEIIRISKNISSTAVFGLGYGNLKQDDIRIKNNNFFLEIKGLEKKGVSSLIGLELDLHLTKKLRFYLGGDYILLYTNIKQLKSIKMILITSGINYLI